MRRQVASTAGSRVRGFTESDRRAASSRLRDALLAGRNADGGWGYYPGKASRLEPTCWAMLALGSGPAPNPARNPAPNNDARAHRDSAAAWLVRCQRSSGWLIEDPQWPFNIAFNALAAFTLQHQRVPTSPQAIPQEIPEEINDTRRRVLAAVVASKGTPAPAAADLRQDNSLQGWSWIAATFSWVEPTCWGLLALKKARGAGISDAAMTARIVEAERLLIDRSCRPGGWNFGNAVVLSQDLRPYVPTTALGLLAMQDRRDDDAVVRGLETLETLWHEEISAIALGLSLVCLGVYGRPTDQLLARVIDHGAKALTFGNHHGIALALFALSSHGQPHAFRL